MPSRFGRLEFCPECTAPQQPRSTSIRNGEHHGRACRMSRCREHCQCTPTAQREWLRIVRDNTIRSSFSCTECARISRHTCAYSTLSTQFDTGDNRGHSARTLCALCCLCSHIEPGESYQWYERTNRCRTAATDVRVCGLCRQVRPAHAFIGATCMVCVGATSCRRCARYNIAGVTPCCATCPTCCECEGSSSNRAFRARPRLYTCGVTQQFMTSDQLTTSKYNPISRTIGVELEVAGFRRPKRRALENLYNTCTKWQAAIGTDGSISGSNGVEIRTSPTGGNKFLLQMREVLGAIRAANGFVNNSCGTHVHVGMHLPGDQDPRVLENLIGLWAYTEDTFLQLVSNSRLNNQYCRPIGKNYKDAITYFQRYDQRQIHPDGVLTYRNARDAAQKNGRYATLNTQALIAHQTIEFRLHHGTVDPTVIIPWAMLLSAFVCNVRKTTEIRPVIDMVEAYGGRVFMYAIAPTTLVREYLARTFHAFDRRHGAPELTLRDATRLQARQAKRIREIAEQMILRTERAA